MNKELKPIEKPPPTVSRSFGELGKIDVDVYIEQAVLKAAVEYARTQPKVMVLGVMVGEFGSWEGRRYTHIMGFIPALKAVSRAVSASFTREAWDAVTEIREQRYPDLPLVGWMQSHPGLGIFLGAPSMAIHQGFFNLPFQVQLTVDPQTDRLGFFGWKGTGIEKTGFSNAAPPKPPVPPDDRPTPPGPAGTDQSRMVDAWNKLAPRRPGKP